MLEVPAGDIGPLEEGPSLRRIAGNIYIIVLFCAGMHLCHVNKD